MDIQLITDQDGAGFVTFEEITGSIYLTGTFSTLLHGIGFRAEGVIAAYGLFKSLPDATKSKTDGFIKLSESSFLREPGYVTFFQEFRNGNVQAAGEVIARYGMYYSVDEKKVAEVSFEIFLTGNKGSKGELLVNYRIFKSGDPKAFQSF